MNYNKATETLTIKIQVGPNEIPYYQNAIIRAIESLSIELCDSSIKDIDIVINSLTEILRQLIPDAEQMKSSATFS